MTKQTTLAQNSKCGGMRCASRPARTKAKLAASLLVLMALSHSSAQGQTYIDLPEQEIISGNRLEDKSTAYYQLLISDTFFTGKENLAIRVIAESFGSDPDIFISKTNPRPSSSMDSDWYCVKKGSDTCVIQRNEITQWDTLNIAVSCMTGCDYTIVTDYFTTVSLEQDVRTQMRLEGHSSNLFEYYVPQDASDGFARAITFTIESDDEYNPIDVYFSLDSQIYQVEERKQEGLLSNGVGYYFTENDYGWCTRCFIYFYVEVMNPGRYYVTAKATARNPVIPTEKTSEKFVNARQQDCFQYFVNSEMTDLLLTANQYIGDAEVYIGGQKIPAGPYETADVYLRASRAPQMQLILTAADRARLGFRTGLYEVCIFGLQDSTVGLTPREENTGGRYTASDSVVYTLPVYSRRTQSYFVYSPPLSMQKSNMTLRVEGLNANLTSGQAPPRVYYRICESDQASECTLNASEQNGTVKNMVEVSPQHISGTAIRLGQLQHDPKTCKTPKSCFYLFSVFYQGATDAVSLRTPMVTSFQVIANISQSQLVTVDEDFKNILPMGRYFYYQLQPTKGEDGGFLDALTIQLESLIGDAELVVSTSKLLPRLDDLATEGTLISRQSGRWDSVTLLKQENFTLNRPIYIGVYASSLAVYTLKFDPVYSLQYQIKLERAQPLVESTAVSVTYKQEYEESFFSFAPWWAASENRTIVLLADVWFNNIFFYAKLNDFPQFYTTELQDVWDVIALDPSQYKVSDSLYIRTRPDFALYDMISQRQYIFDFYAFSQPSTGPAAQRFIDLQCGESLLNYANGTSNYYRHYLIDQNATLNLTVQVVMGNPSIVVKLARSPQYPTSQDPQTYDFRKEAEDPNESETIIMDSEWRQLMDVDCDKAGYPDNGGNKVCTVYFAIECPGQCVYRTTLALENRKFLNQTVFKNPKVNIPYYLPSAEDFGDQFYTGSVGFDEIMYFYYPVAKNQSDMVLYLNKTGPIGKNGDVRVVLSVQGNAGKEIFANQTNKFDNWFYPNKTVARISSATNITTQPEIIEICPRTFDLQCSTTSCVIVIGVIGTTKNLQSQFRLTSFTSQNKLNEKTPIQSTIAQAGTYQYFWFSSNASVINPQAYWEYVVATSIRGGPALADVDLFISAIDGRRPSSEDFDFKSDNRGADEVMIRSTDPLWQSKGYYKEQGIVFVVGVKALTDNATFSLLLTGPQRFEVNYTSMAPNVQYLRQLTPQNSSHVYRFMNWGHRDFRVSVDITDGNVTAHLNAYSDRNFTNNAYMAIPINENNSRWTDFGSTAQKLEVRITKDDPVLFCYYCIYYLTIRSTNATAVPRSSYRVSYSNVPDGGEEIPSLTLGNAAQINIPATGGVVQRRFILDQKEPFNLRAQMNSGKINMYITLSPGASQKQVWKADSASSTTPDDVQINVKQTDINFQLGAFYYVILQSTDGRCDIRLTLNQKRSVLQLQPGASYKQEYYTSEERVKYYFFQVPSSLLRQQVRSTLQIRAFTKDFYPIVYVSNTIPGGQITDPSQQLTYPNYGGSANFTFGENVTQVIGQESFRFSFLDTPTSTNTFYTVAVYSWSYGLTDMRKPEFRLSLTVENAAATPISLQASAEPQAYTSDSLSVEALVQ